MTRRLEITYQIRKFNKEYYRHINKASWPPMSSRRERQLEEQLLESILDYGKTLSWEDQLTFCQVLGNYKPMEPFLDAEQLSALALLK